MSILKWLIGGSDDEGDYDQYQKDMQEEYWKGVNEDGQGRSGQDSDAREGSNWSCNDNPAGRD